MAGFVKATKKKAKLRLMIEGAAGSGKTTAALTIAQPFGKIALIDTECGSASLYSDSFDFDVMELSAPYTPESYIEGINAAASEGYDIVIVDSITHEWSGAGGCLEIQNKLGGRFQDWAKVTPRHNNFVNAILSCPIHVIATVRSKTDYQMDEKSRKVTKQGLAPQQREGLDFEMTAVFSLNQAHLCECTKDRTKLFDGRQFYADANEAAKLLAWLNSGETPAPVIDWQEKAKELVKGVPEEKREEVTAIWKDASLDWEGKCHAIAQVTSG